MEPRFLDLSTELAWLNNSNCRSRGWRLSEDTLLRRADSCSKYSARTRSRMSGNGTAEGEEERRGGGKDDTKERRAQTQELEPQSKKRSSHYTYTFNTKTHGRGSIEYRGFYIVTLPNNVTSRRTALCIGARRERKYSVKGQFQWLQFPVLSFFFFFWFFYRRAVLSTKQSPHTLGMS